ncbi:quinone oxidoreductase [Rhodotorula toruloides]|uniref:Quinone oxidoreductase n=1 Tax=Rhodotorula toruloides TaxID=5286 RepID=A0A511K813_RHOTO|nr:quinone oxidoreductase [Rhodotorula toruloides]
MAAPSTTKVWTLQHKPRGPVTADTFALEEKTIRPLNDGELLVKLVYLSNDPAQRTWIDPSVIKERAYGPAPDEGDAMPSGFVGKVVQSKSASWKEGDLVNGLGSWSEYLVCNEKAVFPARTLEGYPESIALSALGMTTLTAYCGLHEVGHIKPEHTVVISGAAGATGSAAVQIAKNIVGCKRVIGIAGGPEKCAWVKKLGADECLDYRSSSFNDDLIKATEGYVDVYFDNVGGSILNAMFARMKRFSRIIACGAISGYNSREAVNLNNIFEVISMRITMQGFIVSDFMQKWPAAIEAVKKAIKEGKFTTEGTETLVKAKFEDVPQVWQRLFSGQNQGKLVTQLEAQGNASF